MKKVNELTNPPKDPNSPESQEFLKELQTKIQIQNDAARKMIEEWQEEDRCNETK